MAIIEGVDQVDEALRLVALGRLDDRDLVENDRVKGPREREEIGGAERLFTEIGEGKPGDIGCGLRHRDRVAEHA